MKLKTYFMIPVIALAACENPQKEKSCCSKPDEMEVVQDTFSNAAKEQVKMPVIAPIDSTKAHLIFFGFTSCKTICPIGMGNIAQAMERLKSQNPEIVKNLQVVFVTTDPEIDTPEKTKQWLSNFGDDFSAITGPQSELDSLYEEYGATAGGHHSPFAYLVLPDGTSSVIQTQGGPDDIVQKIKGGLEKKKGIHLNPELH